MTAEVTAKQGSGRHCYSLLFSWWLRLSWQRVLFLFLGVVSVLTLLDEVVWDKHLHHADAAAPARRQTTRKTQQHCRQTNSSTMNAAIILFGVPKDFSTVWEWYQRNLILVNPYVHFHVTMHKYSDVTVLTNPKNNEKNVTIETLSEIKSILEDNTSATKRIPHAVVQSRQAEYDKSLEWINEKIHIKGRMDQPPWDENTLRNMFRQGNSMALAYLEAAASSQKFDMYIFLRSDTLLTAPLILPCPNATEVEDGLVARFPPDDLWLPSWQVHKDEYVDRLAVAGMRVANLYAHAKIQGMRMLVQDNAVKKIRNSEHMLYLWLKNPLNVHRVNVRRMPTDWAPLVRIRGGGKLNKRDFGTHLHPQGTANLVLAVLSLVGLLGGCLVSRNHHYRSLQSGLGLHSCRRWRRNVADDDDEDGYGRTFLTATTESLSLSTSLDEEEHGATQSNVTPIGVNGRTATAITTTSGRLHVRKQHVQPSN